MSENPLEEAIEKFNVFTQKPANFLTVQTEIRDDIKSLVKSLYDFTKSTETSGNKSGKSALPELIINDFDEEQIWQEIELQNSDKWDDLVWDVANCMSLKDDLVFPVSEANSENTVAPEDMDASGAEDDSDPEDDNSLHSGSEQSHDQPTKQSRPVIRKSKSKPSIVDDKFFKLHDMEKFLINEDKKEGKPQTHDSDEESIDYFEEIDDEDSEEEGKDVKELKYSDFFEGDGNENYEVDEDMDEEDLDDNEEKDEPKKNNIKKVSFADDVAKHGASDDESSDRSEDDSEPDHPAKSDKPTTDERKSEFERRQERLKQQISKLEDKMISDAPWQLKGEVDAKKRPQNSLLEEVVDFDVTSRPPPVITEQTTLTLEDIIKQRIKDKAWDDVVKKEKPLDDALSFRKTAILDQSKSKLSLAQVYEQEYLKQKQALNQDDDVEEKEPESHTEIREAMDKLFAKLDALCHNHYTPKAPQPEVKIVSNTPAISMEEVAPVSVSDAALLAPEEVKKKRSGDLMSKEERTNTDKKRERRKKKKLQKEKGSITKVTDNRNTKKAVESSNDKSFKTSKAFFQQLNDNATSIIKNSSKRKSVKNKGQ